ncbi:MAG: BspA family leucine-rich repeat surface protein [Bacteroides sp.]
MKTIAKLLGLALVMLSLWGCGGQPQSETSTQNEAAVQEAQPEAANSTIPAPSGKRPFITKWKGEAGEELQIPILGTYTLTWYNEATPNERHTEQVTVTTEMVEDLNGEEDFVEKVTPYTFETPTDGVYVVEAGSEGVDGIFFTHELDIAASKLLTVEQFGDVVWKRLDRAFYRCENMQFAKGIDTPNLSQCKSLAWMFRDCARFNSPLAHWDVSHVTNMEEMFDHCSSFNQPLAQWNVSKVTNMSSMFWGCTAFNQPLNNWDIEGVTDMSNMFRECTVFNQPLDKWNVRQVTSMIALFYECRAFNQPLNSWDVSKVEYMGYLFYECTVFNQSLAAWNINNVRKEGGMQSMFYNCPAGKLPFVEKWKAAGYEF